jgi:hypothetical protein
MEQQPFESRLALVRSLGPMGKASVAAFRRPPSRAVRKLRAVYFLFYVAQVFRSEVFDFGWASFLRYVDFDLFASEETQT